MTAQKGEERLLTVFADVHYYFSTPSPRPLSHRFDKGSYLYLHGNKSGNGGRLEIANNVGRPELDAVTGSLESTTIRQSYKHPTLCTLTVDGYKDRAGTTLSPFHRPEHHWKLPFTDPRNERNLSLHLHTLDIYFWTDQDADSFVAAARKLLQTDQIELLDMPRTPVAHEQVMSPVVQQLENVAVQDPAYHNGQTRDSRTIPGPDSPPPGMNSAQDAARTYTPKTENSTAYQPLAYNPAAPAAPEPISHREKTPPPVDSETGTGLAAAAHADHMQAMSPQSSLSRPSYGNQQSSQGYVGSPPAQPYSPSHMSPLPSPFAASTNSPPSAVAYRVSSVSSLPLVPPPSQQSGRSSVNQQTALPTFDQPPRNPQGAASPPSQQAIPAFSPPPQDPNAHLHDRGNRLEESPATQILGGSYIGGIHQPLQHVQPQYADYLGSGHQMQTPGGGYSNYQYSQQQQQHHQHQGHQSQGSDYDIHSQVYRPTEEEIYKTKQQRPYEAGSGQQSGRLEQGAGRVDKGVNRFFKKLEKRIG